MTKQMMATIFLFFTASVVSFAQTPEQAIQEARDRFSDIKNRSFELERSKREAAKRPVEKDSEQIIPKIKEDFEQIQKINSNFLQTPSANSPIDYAAVLKAASEINRRAINLKSVLFPDEPEEEKKTQNAASTDIKSLINDLDKSISGFVHSSIFQNIKVVDTQESVKARNDLDAVVKISFLIKKKARSLVKEDSGK